MGKRNLRIRTNVQMPSAIRFLTCPTDGEGRYSERVG